MMKWISLLAVLVATQSAFAKGKIQNEDIKSLSELVSAGGTMSQLPNDTKIYVTANGINTQLSTAIQSGVIGGGGSGGGGFSVLKNPGFEVGLTNWTNTGGTFSAVSSGSNLLIGQGSATFQASGTGQFMSSTSYLVPNGLAGTPCVIGVLYKGGDANLTLQAFDGTNVLASAPLSPMTVPTMQYATFQCPSSGNFQARVISSGSSALVALDNFFLGQNLISTVSQASYVGGISVTPGCYLANVATGFMADMTTSGCSGSTLLGQASSFASSGNGSVTFNNLPPGEYLAQWTANCQAATASNFAVEMTDGVTTSTQFSVGTSSSLNAPCTFTMHSTYTTAGAHTFKIQGYQGSGAGDGIVYMSTGGAGQPEPFSLYRFPSNQETLVTPQTINWIVDAIQSGAALALPTTTGSWGPQELIGSLTLNNYGTQPAQQACQGAPATGTSCGGNARGGVTFSVPAAQRIKVCAEFDWSMNSGGGQAYSTFRISEVDNSAFTENVMGNHNSQNAYQNTLATIIYIPNSLCQDFSIPASGTYTFEIVASGNNPNGIGGQSVAANSGQSNIHWTARPLTQSLPAPVFLPPAAFRVEGTPTGTAPSGAVTTATWSSLGANGYDTNNAMNVGTGEYTIPVSGLWHFDCSLALNQNAGTDYQYDVYITTVGTSVWSFGQIYYDATATASRTRTPKTFMQMYFTVGQKVVCQSSLNIPGSYAGDFTNNYFEGYLVH